MLNVPNFPSRQANRRSYVNKCTVKCLAKSRFIIRYRIWSSSHFQLRKKKDFFHVQQGKVLLSLYSTSFQRVHLQNIAPLLLLFTPVESDSPYMLCGALHRTGWSNTAGGASCGNHFMFYYTGLKQPPKGTTLSPTTRVAELYMYLEK